MENKRYLKELNEEELKEVFENISSLQEISFSYAYDVNMDWQLELGKIFFGNNWHDYLKMYDYYSSFYLKIKNTIEFFENISIGNADYLSEENSKKYIDLYKQAKKIYNNLCKCNTYSEKYLENEEKLDKICIELLELLENELHELENIDFEQAFETFKTDVFDNENYNDLYVLNNDFSKIYEHVNYIKEYV